MFKRWLCKIGIFCAVDNLEYKFSTINTSKLVKLARLYFLQSTSFHKQTSQFTKFKMRFQAVVYNRIFVTSASEDINNMIIITQFAVFSIFIILFLFD